MHFLVALSASLGLAAAALQAPIQLKDAVKVPGKNVLTYCESPDNDILKISNVDLSPNPPEKGKPLKITATGELTQDVAEGSYVLLTVKTGYITLIKRNESLCDALEQVDKKCPLKKGPLTFEKEVNIPGQIPPAKFNAHADVYDSDDKRVTCLEALDIQFT